MELTANGVLAQAGFVVRIELQTHDPRTHSRFVAALALAAEHAESLPDYGLNAKRGSRHGNLWFVVTRSAAEARSITAALAHALGEDVPYVVAPPMPLRRNAWVGRATGSGTVKFQTGSPAHYAHVEVTIATAGASDALRFRYAPRGDFLAAASLDDNERARWIHAMFDGVVAAAKLGAITGLACRDLLVTITDGKLHEVDSRESDFRLAAGLAFADAVRRPS